MLTFNQGDHVFVYMHASGLNFYIVIVETTHKKLLHNLVLMFFLERPHKIIYTFIGNNLSHSLDRDDDQDFMTDS